MPEGEQESVATRPDRFGLEMTWEDEQVIDLTRLGPRTAYTEVLSMLLAPQEYLGRTIKMDGVYYEMFAANTGLTYHYIGIVDENACCQEGIEIILPEDYPLGWDAYLESDVAITVTGTFGSYEELGATYYGIRVESLEETK